MYSVLTVEDDGTINGLLRETLEKEGYECTQAFSGTEAKMLLSMHSYHLVLLDLMLPGLCVEEVLKEVRKQGNTPVIVLTAKDTIDDKVDVLRGGADDCVTKPFDIKEVLARVEVQIRRTEDSQVNPQKKVEKLQYEGLELDRERFQIVVCGTEIPKITK